MNIKELIAEVTKEESVYEELPITPVYYYEYERLNNSVQMPLVWDKLVEELERFPNQEEFIIEGMKQSREYFTDVNKTKQGKRWHMVWSRSGKHWHGFDWSELRLRQAVASRLHRSYYSMVAEATVELALKQMYSDATVITDIQLDFNLGSDVTMILDNHVYYIHVLKDSESSLRSYNKKANGKSYFLSENSLADDGRKKKVYVNRDFNKAHIKVMYDEYSSTKTIVHNAITFVKPEYIEEQLDKAVPEHYEGSQLQRFHELLVSHGKEGIKGVEEYEQMKNTDFLF